MTKILTNCIVFLFCVTSIGAQDWEVQLNDNPFRLLNNETFNANPYLVDFDSDGDDDLFFTNAYKSSSFQNIIQYAFVYFENIDGQYERKDLNIEPNLGLSDIVGFGTNAIKLSVVDFDMDGDFDIFSGVQGERQFAYLENVEGEIMPNNEANPFSDLFLSNSTFDGLDIGDIDGDGVYDAVIAYDEAIDIYKLDSGKFVLESTLAIVPEDGAPFEDLFPTLVDLDGDLDLDLAISTTMGKILSYENENGIFTVSDSDYFAGLEKKDSENISFSDSDNDGDLDAILGNTSGTLTFFERIDDAYTFMPLPISGLHFYGVRSPITEFADLDGDGDLDLLINSFLEGIKCVINEDGAYEAKDSENPFTAEAGLDFVRTISSCDDFDGDGDTDCIVGELFTTEERYFENVDGSFILKSESPYAEFTKDFETKQYELVDLDNDGDKDLFVAANNGDLFYYEFDGSAFISKDLDFLSEIKGTRPSFLDFDGDDDLDMVYSWNGLIRYFENVDGAYLAREGDENPFGNLPFEIGSGTLVDIDGDSDYDILGSTFSGNEVLFINQRLESSTKDIAHYFDISVFPNPAKEIITVETPWNLSVLTIELYDNKGAIVASKKSSGLVNILDVSKLNSGNYFLRVKSNDGQAVEPIVLVK